MIGMIFLIWVIGGNCLKHGFWGLLGWHGLGNVLGEIGEEAGTEVTGFIGKSVERKAVSTDM